MIDINVSSSGNATVISVGGRIDSMNANQLGEALLLEIDNGNNKLVLDLARVDYMSSAGLREIVTSLKRAKRADGDLRVAEPSERLLDIFEMAGLDTILQIFSTQGEAIKSY